MKREARLILGGGAAYGLAHIGALEALLEQFEITGVVGTSMGAIVGGLFAMGNTPAEILDIAMDSGSASVFNPMYSANGKALSLNLLKGLHPGRATLNLFERCTGGAVIQDLPIPYVAVAYDLRSRKTILIDKGPLAEAMRASSSIPMLFPPHRWGRYQFVDGGVEHPLPVAFGDSVPGMFTVAINVLPPVSTEAERILIEPAARQRRIWPHQVFVQSLLQNQGYIAIQSMLHKPPDLYIDAHDPQKKMFDLFQAKEFYDYGLRVARISLSQMEEPNFMEQVLKKYHTLLIRFFKK